ncbi:MAG: peptidylprolyl isomerase [Spirochaetaceae bacterium]|jgi:FKBP-type peptidyl-prolyl cis-trans isomerase SlyD|nr:peptidylprolyl isomerase [Spirochaetaceae bacterium]
MKVQKDYVVSIDYILTDDEGTVLDSSEGENPLEYLHGHEEIMTGLEKALEGKEVEDKISVVLPPEEGYGVYYDELVAKVPKDQFDVEGEIEEGMQFEAETADGPRLVTVVDISDDMVTVDANHPLAGETLHFEVTITGIREATDEELENGLDQGCGCGEDDCDDCNHGCGCN